MRISTTLPISVVIPVHNGATYIAETIRSVQSQVGEAHEVLVINDGSSDGTAQVLRDFSGVRVISIPHRIGIGAARNLGVKLATCELIAFIDSDDIALSDWLMPQAQLITQSASLLFSLARVIDFVDPNTGCAPVLRCLETGTPRLGLLLGGVFRRSAFEKIGPFREDVSSGEDVEWLSRADSMGVSYAVSIAPSIYRRLHWENATANLEANRRDLFRIIRDKIGGPQRINRQHPDDLAT